MEKAAGKDLNEAVKQANDNSIFTEPCCRRRHTWEPQGKFKAEERGFGHVWNLMSEENGGNGKGITEIHKPQVHK